MDFSNVHSLAMLVVFVCPGIARGQNPLLSASLPIRKNAAKSLFLINVGYQSKSNLPTFQPGSASKKNPSPVSQLPERKNAKTG